MSLLRDFSANARASGAPVTVAIVITWIATFILSLLKVIGDAGFLFDTARFANTPWTVLTYSFAMSAGPIALLFSCLWFWGIGGSVERELGSPKFLAVYIVFATLSALAVLLGANLLGTRAILAGPWVVLSTMTIIWATRNPEAEVMFMFVIKIKAKYLGWISAFLVLFSVQGQDVRMAAFAAVPLALAYFFAATKLPGLGYSRGASFTPRAKKVEMTGRGKVVREGYFEDVKKREKDREERERLRKLFEGSVNDEENP